MNPSQEVHTYRGPKREFYRVRHLDNGLLRVEVLHRNESLRKRLLGSDLDVRSLLGFLNNDSSQERAAIFLKKSLKTFRASFNAVTLNLLPESLGKTRIRFLMRRRRRGRMRS